MPFLLLQTTSRFLALGSLVLAAPLLASACGNACGEGSRCLEGQCTPIAAEGAPCAPGGCAAGLWCPPSFRCARTTVLGPDCDPEAEGACGDGWCDILARRCSPLPAIDDDCTIDGRCAYDSFCFLGRCTAVPGEREPCLSTEGQACASGLYCDGSLCVRPGDGSCPAVPLH